MDSNSCNCLGSELKFLIIHGNYYSYHLNDLGKTFILYALKGSFVAKNLNSNETYEIRQGSFFIIKNPKNFLLRNNGNEESIIVCFMLPEQTMLRTVYQTVQQQSPLFDVFRCKQIKFTIPQLTHPAPAQKRIFEEGLYFLIERQQLEKDVSANYLPLIFKQLIMYLDCHIQENYVAASIPILGIINYVRENIQTVTLEDLAQKYGCSISFLSEIINEQTGYSFSQLLHSIKMEKSIELLNNTDNSLDDISEAVGYASRQGFISAFRSTYQITPSEYRKPQTPLN